MSRLFLFLVACSCMAFLVTGVPQHSHDHGHHHGHDHHHSGDFTKQDCQEAPHEGRALCVGSGIAYAWNQDDRECQEIVHGDACIPTRNHFATLKECEAKAKTLCVQ